MVYGSRCKTSYTIVWCTMVIPNYEEVQAELREFTKRRPQLSFNTFQRFYRAFVYMRRGGVSFHHRTHDFLYDVLYDQGTGMEDTSS